MKPLKFLPVLALATLTIFSCNWFKSKHPDKSNPLSGNWKLDSVSIGRDSNLVYFLLLSSISEDSLDTDFKFNNDSLFTFLDGDADTTLYHFNEKKNQLTLDDEPDEIYRYAGINDSTISLTLKDGSIIFLKKQ